MRSITSPTTSERARRPTPLSVARDDRVERGGNVTDVVVTGLGATTPLGGDVPSTWEALLAGRSGVSRIEADWVERHELPVKIAAQLAVEPSEVLKRVEARRMDRCEQVAIIAAREAWQHAGA